jgi:class 3 adenylate cyclase
MASLSDIEQLKKAIAALEAQRETLGDQVVEAALSPMRDRLAELQAATLNEQRKLVTVLFTDLAGHTTLFARLDAEDVHEIIAQCFSTWRASIDRHGGYVEKYIGDAVLAVFGLSAAQEDDPERAVRCALEMRQRLEDLNGSLERTWGIRLRMRTGITTGEVVVSNLDDRKRGEFVVIGETVNLASRLQGLSPEDGILISHDTYRLVRGIFNVLKLEPVKVKGVEEPVQVYQVRAAKPRAFRIAARGVEGVETPMIGREADLKRLQDEYLEIVEERERRVVSIVGEPGIGKSRLIYEFGNWLELLPEVLYYFKGRAYQSTQSLPYSLVRSVMAFRFEIHDSDAPLALWEKLERGVGEVLGRNGALSRKAYFIGRLLGFELGDHPQWSESEQDVRYFHEQALAYLGEYFRTLAQAHPVVVLLEDIHWADDSSLDLIYSLEGALAEQPLLIVCTARPRLYERRPNWGEGLIFHKRIDLLPLSRRESRQLVEQILQKVQAVPQELRELVVERAEGNPFFIEEVLKILIDEGVIEKSHHYWQVHLHKLKGIKIPQTLSGVLQARLDSLIPNQRSLLQRAAVIGRVFWDRAVDYLETEEKQVIPAGELLGELRAREIVFKRERSSFDDTQEYLFKHTLLRDVSYESLLRRQRRILHTRAAQWLEQTTQRNQRTDEYAALIAQHYEQAGQNQLAAGWYTRAGRQAASRFANAEAVFSFSRAIDLTPLNDTAARYELLLAREMVLDLLGERQRQASDLQSLVQLAENSAEVAHQAEVALRQANFGFATADFPAAISAAQQAIAKAKVIGALDKEAEGYYLWGRSLDTQMSGQDALEILEKALKLARQASMRGLEAEILMNIGTHYSDRSKTAEAREYLTSALQIYRQFGNRHGEGKALGNLGVTYWGQGAHAQAKQHFEMASQVIRETGDRRVEGILVGNLGVIATEQLDYAESRRYHMEALRINREIRNKYSECINLGNLAEVERDLGDFDQAQAYYKQAYQLALELDITQMKSAILISWSLLMEFLGDHQSALGKAQQALTLVREIQSPLYESAGLYRLGQSLLTAGRMAEAEGNFNAAFDLQRQLGLENRAMETLSGIARLHLEDGNPTRALHYVEEILKDLESQNLSGMEEPFRIYLICYQVLEANHDKRAPAILEAGYRFLLDRGDLIKEDRLRRMFLEKVPWNRKLIELWETRPAES